MNKQDKANMEEIYKTYSNQLYKYLFCLTRNESLSEELSQETFCIAYEQIEKFRGDCKLFVWLCQIAKHLYYTEIKKQQKLKTVSLEHLENLSNASNTDAETIAKLDTYQKIDKLDEKAREIMYLKIIGNFTFKEIGQILNISENTARVTFYRGKLKIKESDSNEKE